ncbi:transcription factor [Rhodotorula toruloides]|uniref:Transcription factor n=1 Tax=Rhodotorula toruloides TaxID=5286 RepID=A0A511KN11_RHOTO|nr:transcription factor [Rhodotorula toruloides]
MQRTRQRTASKMGNGPSPLDLLSGVASARVEELATRNRRAGPSSSTGSLSQTLRSSSLRSTASSPPSPPRPAGHLATAHPVERGRLTRDSKTTLPPPYRLDQINAPAPGPSSSSARLVRLSPVSALIPSLPVPHVTRYNHPVRHLAPPTRLAPSPSHSAPPHPRPQLVFEPSRGFRQVEHPPHHRSPGPIRQEQPRRMDHERYSPEQASQSVAGTNGSKLAGPATTSRVRSVADPTTRTAMQSLASSTVSPRIDSQPTPRQSPRPAKPAPAPSLARSKSSTPPPAVRDPTPAAEEPSTTAPSETTRAEGEKDPVVSCTLWEDERCVVTQVLVNGHVVARRSDLDFVNCTKLLNMVPGLTRGKRDMYLKGVWLPLSAAARLARNFDLYDCLYPLFEPDILQFLFRPINRDRTSQLIQAARGREALVSKPDVSSGLSDEDREKLSQRGAALEKMLRELEDGLAATAPKRERVQPPSPSSAQQACEPDKRSWAAYDVDESQRPAKMRRTASSGSAAPPPGPSTRRLDTAFEQRFQADQHQLTYMPHQPPPRPHLPLYTASGYPPPYMTYSIHYQPPPPPPEPTAAIPRRPSMDVGYTRDFRAPVAWYDNPTPPPHDMSDYFASTSGAAMRRLSAVEGALDVVRENEEVQSWPLEGAVAESRPPQAGGDVLRRLSIESDASMGLPLTFEPPYPMQLRDPYGRSLSLPASTDTFAPFCGHQDVYTAQPNVLHRPEQSMPSPNSDFDFGQVQQALYSPPVEPSRLGATRLSIDSAAETVYPQFGLGSTSLVAPHSVGLKRTTGADSYTHWFAKAFDASDWADALARQEAAEAGESGASATASERPRPAAQLTFANFPEDACASSLFADAHYEASGSAPRLTRSTMSLGNEDSPYLDMSFGGQTMSPSARRDSLCGIVSIDGSLSGSGFSQSAGVKVEPDK